MRCAKVRAPTWSASDSSASSRYVPELPVPALPPVFSMSDALGAVAVPTDAIDSCYMGLAVHSFASFGASGCAPS